MYREISAVLIVKNESQVLDKCLSSLKGADEIIVCDTGSTDNTIEIAKKYTDKVFTDYIWNDDFAGARNHAKSKASYDWILSIDADEVLDPNGIAVLKGLPDGHDAINIRLTGNNSQNVHYAPRFFRKHLDWIGKIHEIIPFPGPICKDTGITYSYSPAHSLDPDRSLRILKKSHEEMPQDSRTMYYLAREYWYIKDYDNAIALWEKYVSISSFESEKADAYLLLARCYIEKGNSRLAKERCLSAIGINPNMREAAVLLSELTSSESWLEMAKHCTNDGVLFVRGTKLDKPSTEPCQKLADIVIPHGNRHDLLVKCLSSFDNKLFNIIVVSGGTFAENCNKGAKTAVTDKIIFLNDDAYPSTESLKEMVDKDVDICGITQIFPNARTMYGMGSNFDGGKLNVYGANVPDFVQIPSGFLFCVKRDFWIKSGGLDESFKTGCEDYDFFMRSLESGASIGYAYRPVNHECSQSEGRYNNEDYNQNLMKTRWPKERVEKALLNLRKG